MTEADIDRLIDNIPSGMLLRPAQHMFARAVEAHIRAALSAPAVPEGLEVVGWQVRRIDPDEGPSVWFACTEDEALIFQRRADRETRQLFAAAPQPQEPTCPKN